MRDELDEVALVEHALDLVEEAAEVRRRFLRVVERDDPVAFALAPHLAEREREPRVDVDECRAGARRGTEDLEAVLVRAREGSERLGPRTGDDDRFPRVQDQRAASPRPG